MRMVATVATSTKVLVVEDNDTTRAMLESMLETEGYDVSIVPNGLQALTHLSDNVPDAVVLDVMMPGIDGFGVLEWIRANEGTRSIPVLMLTALDDGDSTWKGWATGCNYYMTKPFEIEALLEVLDHLVSGVVA